MGRFGVMRALSELMQSGSIMEVPRNEVGGFAEELKKANRYEQAIGAYRRLLEVSRDPRAKPEILRQISECEEALSTIAATERIEQTRVVPRRPGAPPAGVAQKIIWRPLTGVLVLILIVLLGITVFAVDKLREIALPKNLAAYKETKAAASKLVTSGDYRGAMRVWEDFLAQQPEGQGSDFARGDLNSITKVYEGLVKKELARAGKLEAELKLGEAIAAYEEALGKYPDYDEIADVRNRLAAAKAKQDELLKRLSEQELADKLAQAEKLENNENLSEALEIYKEVARSKGPSSESAKAAVGRLDEKMRRVLALFETGLAHEKSSEYGLALKSFEEADAEWPGSKWAREAKIHASAVKRRARAARLLFEEAKGLEKQGRNEEALRKYLIVAQNYKGFDEARPAREKMNELTGFTRKADEMLARAAEQERSGNLDGAFKIYTKLLSIYGGTSSVKKLRLPVVVHSVPPGAEVYRAGKLLGKAPVELRFKPYESGELELKLSGFEPLTAKYENIRRRTFVCHMRKTPIFVADLGLRMSGEALPTGARIYVAAERSVLALRRFSGKEVWRCELFKPSEVPDEMGHNPLVSAADPAYWDVRGRPALVVGHLYVAARDGRLHVLEATTGNEVGKVTLKAPVDTGIETVTSELMAGKPFGYAVDWQGNFLGLDLAADGKLRWTKPVGARSHHKGAVTGRLICYGAASGKLAAFDLRTGTPAWEVQTAGKILTAPSARGDLVAVYSEGDGLYLVRADGTVKARRKLPLRGEGWPCLGDKAVALCEGDGKLRGFDVDGLKDLWEGSVDGKASGAPATTGRRVYIGSAGGKVYCFDMEKGTVLWQLAAGSPVTSPMSLSEGALFFGTEAGKFFALEVE